MKVVDVQTVVGTPWRELAFVELVTDEGLRGLGEARMVSKTDALLACIQELAARRPRRRRPAGGPDGRDPRPVRPAAAVLAAASQPDG